LLAGSAATLLLVRVGDDLVIVDAGADGVTVHQEKPLDPSLGFGTVTLSGRPGRCGRRRRGWRSGRAAGARRAPLLRRAVSLRNLLAAAGDPADVLYVLTESGVRRAYGVDLPPEAEEYRAAARAFVETYRATPEADRRRVIAESGYLVPHWPPPFGRGASPVEQLVIEEELAAVETPDLGITGWVLLTLTQTATQEQIDRWVPTTLAGGVAWCQLFSEPGAGSDAAAVQTRGVKVEGGWLVTGQKVWTRPGSARCPGPGRGWRWATSATGRRPSPAGPRRSRGT
jgi:hypothetical protein